MFLVKLITIVGLLSLQGCGLDSLRNSTHDADSEGYSECLDWTLSLLNWMEPDNFIIFMKTFLITCTMRS